MAEGMRSLMAGRGLDPGQAVTAEDLERACGWATASLVLGILGIVLIPIICSLLAIIFSAIALNDTGRNPELGGRGLAIAGLTLGIVGVAIGLIIIGAVAAGG